MAAKSAQHKIGDYQLTSSFNGYVARKDQTMLDPSYLIAPSKNVVIGTSGRVGTVSGYTLDGASSSAIDSGIKSFWDFDNFKGDRRNLRAGFMTATQNDGKLQFRYNNGTTVSWNDLLTGLTSVDFSFTRYSDTTEKIKECLMVNGTSNVYEWNGAVTEYKSSTATTLTKKGTYLTASTISFQTGAKTITDSASGFITAGFAANDVILVTGSASNNGTYQILTVTAGLITLVSSSTLVNELAGASVTIKTKGTKTWAEEGFYTTRDKKIKLNGIEYTYTGGETTNTLTGITPNVPTSTVGDVIFQSVVTTAVSTITSMESTFQPTVIGNGKDNQVYFGMATSQNQYISKVNNYKDCSFSSNRLVGEGMLLILKSPPIAYVPQEVQSSSDAYDMYIASGKNTWQIVRSTLSSDNSKEKLELIDLKVAPLQGAKSEKLVSKMKNHIIFVGNDNVANMLGYMSYQYVPVMTDFSYSIIDDMKSYDLTDASIHYYKNYIYLAVPRHGIVRIYNMVDQSQQQHQYQIEGIDNQPWFWEAPIGYPVSGFYEVDGELYGHGYNTSESYKLFTGGSFNGQDIDANATFAFDDKGERTQSKASDEIWVEGYIRQNTILKIQVAGDLDYFRVEKNMTIDGSDSRLVAYGGKSGAIGKDPIGSQPLGGALTTTDTLDAWFHGAKSYTQFPFYLEQISFSSKGVDRKWELICFGTNAKMTAEGNNWITE